MRESYIRLIQYFLGIIIFIFIGFHLSLFTQLLGPGYTSALEYHEVTARMRSLSYDLIYIILLFSLLTHGFIGLRNILYEIFTSSRSRLFIKTILLIIYLGFMIYGIIPIISSGEGDLITFLYGG